MCRAIFRPSEHRLPVIPTFTCTPISVCVKPSVEIDNFQTVRPHFVKHTFLSVVYTWNIFCKFYLTIQGTSEDIFEDESYSPSSSLSSSSTLQTMASASLGKSLCASCGLEIVDKYLLKVRWQALLGLFNQGLKAKALNGCPTPINE